MNKQDLFENPTKNGNWSKIPSCPCRTPFQTFQKNLKYGVDTVGIGRTVQQRPRPNHLSAWCIMQRRWLYPKRKTILQVQRKKRKNRKPPRHKPASPWYHFNPSIGIGINLDPPKNDPLPINTPLKSNLLQEEGWHECIAISYECLLFVTSPEWTLKTNCNISLNWAKTIV